jgi:hypothetical protein
MKKLVNGLEVEMDKSEEGSFLSEWKREKDEATEKPEPIYLFQVLDEVKRLKDLVEGPNADV